MRKRRNENRLVAFDDPTTPLGRIHLASFLDDSRGVPAHPMRVLGHFCLVLLLEGSGSYRDANGFRQKAMAGDVIFVFPKLAHWYGPGESEEWNEFFVTFDGPLFDMLLETGVLDSTRPIRHIDNIIEWLQKLEDVFDAPHPATIEQATLQIIRFSALLVEFALQETPPHISGDVDALWLHDIYTLLEENLSRRLTSKRIIEHTQMSPDMFRKRFQQLAGISPARYRTQRRMESACAMLQQSKVSNKEIARSLGYSDDSHFCKNFKIAFGITPKQYRKKFGEGEINFQKSNSSTEKI